MMRFFNNIFSNLRNARSKAGFTLIEIMVTLGLLVLLTSLTLPPLLRWRTAAQLRGAASNLKGDLELAKMRAIRENEITVGSVGKNVIGIRRNILMFASGITALSGTLLAFYFSYVVEANYQRAFWTYWPWLMLILGGPGNNAGTFLGCALVVAMRRVIIVNKWFLQEVFFFPVAYFEQILLGVLLIAVIMFRPNGLIPEKLLYVPGVNYRKLVDEEVVVDWRSAPKARGVSSGISGVFRTLGGKKEEEAGD